ncbi:RmlC-like cupin domain-containing protein [Amylocystis lapponica]|nr:RmlC-like cupin domain-containing protein [Amylocystis lapponica]
MSHPTAYRPLTHNAPRAMAATTRYSSYSIPNSVLIDQLKLIKHPEGGYFAETDRQSEQVPSPFAHGASRSLATTIYYLLTPDEPNGVFHMNKSATMHVLHQGRAEYTLITPATPPRIEKKVMGPNIHAGEVLQLLVPSGVWKMSRILPEDLSKEDRENTGCLITEVVFPGFAWEDHGFLSRTDLQALFAGTSDAEEWLPYVKKT